MAKHRIVMHRGTVIDADYIAPMLDNPEILLVGIGPGNGPTRIRHIHTPKTHPDFWTPITHTSYGQGCKGQNDPSHSDYVVTPKFQHVITMHMRNIKSIDGKSILYVDSPDSINRGISRLDFDESWSIDNISDLLED